MGRFIVRIVMNAVAIWLATLIVAGVKVTPFGTEWWAIGLTYLLVATIFAIVNGIVGTVIKVVAFPIYILTLGLISLIVNGVLLLITAWVSGLFGFGLKVEGFWWGVLGAIVISIVNWILGIFLRPQQSKKKR